MELGGLDAAIPLAVDRIVRRCLEKRPEERFQTAHDVALALEAVLQAPPGSALLEEVEERSPYPGLRSFTETDAGVFFGREEEVAGLWEKLRRRRLLAVIGPSGAGKTSFLRAGVIPARPEGWGALVCTPGAAPLRGLGRALVPQLSGDSEALARLVDIDDPEVAIDLVGRWRKRHGEALARRGPVRGAVHAEPDGDAGTLRGAARAARRARRTCTSCWPARRLPRPLPGAAGAGPVLAS